MKNILIFAIIILGVHLLSGAFEESIEGVYAKGIGGVCMSCLSVSSLCRNPAIAAQLEHINFGISSGLIGIGSDEGHILDITALAGTSLYKKHLGLSGGFKYKGLSDIAYPGLNNIAYSEILAELNASVGFFKYFSIGAGGIFQQWNVGGDRNYLSGKNYNFKVGLYVHKIAKILSIGMVAENLFGGKVDSGNGFSEEIIKKINFSISFDTKIIETGLQGEYIINAGFFNTGIGCSLFLFKRILHISMGCLFKENFMTIIPTAGFAIKELYGIEYAFQYPVSFLDSYGRHYVELNVKFGK